MNTKNQQKKKSYQKEKKMTHTLVTGASVRIKGEGERQTGDDETSLLVPSSPDSSVTGDKRV